MARLNDKDEICMYSGNFARALLDVLRNKENDFYINTEGKDITNLLTGMILGLFTVIGSLSRQNGDLLELMCFVNKLIVQYLMEHGSIK